MNSIRAGIDVGMRRFLLIGGVIGFFLIQLLRAENFEEANRLYEQQKYQQAVEAYRAMIRGGTISPSVLFNLGNAFFKQGNVGQAVLQYRKAQLLAPRDPDIRANLHFARDHFGIEAPPGANLLERFSKGFTANELGGLTLAGGWSLGLLLVAVQLWPRIRGALKPYLISAALFTLGSCALLGSWWHANKATVRAVVISSGVHARFGPLAESQQAFDLKEGVEVWVSDRKSQWWQVTDDGKRFGWVLDSSLGFLTDAAVLGAGQVGLGSAK